ncbi:MAG: hypothetical protein U0787_21920 [Polyangia bacterium]
MLLLAIYPLSAKGLEPILPSRVCQALVDQKPISECFAAIKQVPVDPLAAGACLRLKVNYPVSMCIRTIAGKRYSPAEISECDDLEDVWETIRCFYQNGQRVAPRNYSGTYADQICPKLQSSRLIRLCVAAFQESYIQPSAALACDRIKGAKQTLDCLTAIMNQRYSEAEVAACDGLAAGAKPSPAFRVKSQAPTKQSRRRSIHSPTRRRCILVHSVPRNRAAATAMAVMVQGVVATVTAVLDLAVAVTAMAAGKTAAAATATAATEWPVAAIAMAAGKTAAAATAMVAGIRYSSCNNYGAAYGTQRLRLPGDNHRIVVPSSTVISFAITDPLFLPAHRHNFFPAHVF